MALWREDALGGPSFSPWPLPMRIKLARGGNNAQDWCCARENVGNEVRYLLALGTFGRRRGYFVQPSIEQVEHLIHVGRGELSTLERVQKMAFVDHPHVNKCVRAREPVDELRAVLLEILSLLGNPDRLLKRLLSGYRPFLKQDFMDEVVKPILVCLFLGLHHPLILRGSSPARDGTGVHRNQFSQFSDPIRPSLLSVDGFSHSGACEFIPRILCECLPVAINVKKLLQQANQIFTGRTLKKLHHCYGQIGDGQTRQRGACSDRSRSNLLFSFS